MFLTVLILLLGLIDKIKLDYPCNCMPIHPQQAYCHSDFVIRAKVIKDRWHGQTTQKIIDNSPRYDIQITTIFKGKNIVEKALNTSSTQLKKNHKLSSHHLKRYGTLYTSSSACTLVLKEGTRYILTGNIMQNRLYMNDCHWRTIWNDKSKIIRKYFKKDSIDCDCEVEPCIGGSCNLVRRTCGWDLTLFPPPCSWKLCKKNGNTCTWSKNIEIDLCKEG